jgi:hypothetical protein
MHGNNEQLIPLEDYLREHEGAVVHRSAGPSQSAPERPVRSSRLARYGVPIAALVLPVAAYYAFTGESEDPAVQHGQQITGEALSSQSPSAEQTTPEPTESIVATETVSASPTVAALPSFLAQPTTCEPIVNLGVGISVPTPYRIRIDRMVAAPVHTDKNDFPSVMQGKVAIIGCMTDPSAVMLNPEKSQPNRKVYDLDMSKYTILMNTDQTTSGIASYSNKRKIIRALRNIHPGANREDANRLKEIFAESEEGIDKRNLNLFKQSVNAQYLQQIISIILQDPIRDYRQQAHDQCMPEGSVEFNPINMPPTLAIFQPQEDQSFTIKRYQYLSNEAAVNITVNPVAPAEPSEEPVCQPQ